MPNMATRESASVFMAGVPNKISIRENSFSIIRSFRTAEKQFLRNHIAKQTLRQPTCADAS
jgi:hypothetical protein